AASSAVPDEVCLGVAWHSGEFSACGILAVAVVTATRRSTPEPEHGIWGCFRSVQSVALLLVALVGALDLLLRVDAAGPGGALHALARLQVLVDLEEVLDLQPVELGQVVDVPQVLLARVVRGHADDLVVAALLVAHPEHPDGAGGDQAPREGRLLDQHQSVQRVTVFTQGVLDEPVVSGVLGGGEQRPVETDPARLVVHLVLVAVPLGDLDGDVEVHAVPHSSYVGCRRAFSRSATSSVDHGSFPDPTAVWELAIWQSGVPSRRSTCPDPSSPGVRFPEPANSRRVETVRTMPNRSQIGRWRTRTGPPRARKPPRRSRPTALPKTARTPPHRSRRRLPPQNRTPNGRTPRRRPSSGTPTRTKALSKAVRPPRATPTRAAPKSSATR